MGSNMKDSGMRGKEGERRGREGPGHDLDRVGRGLVEVKDRVSSNWPVVNYSHV